MRVRWLTVGVLALASCSQPSSSVSTTLGSSTSTTWYTVVERAEAIVACMREEGVDAELREPFGVSYAYGFEAVYDKCNEEIDRTMPFPVLSEEESYAAWVEAADCLRRLGYDIAQAPSFEVWIEEGNENWDPYANVLGDSLGEVHAKCPQPGLGLEPTDP